MHILYILDFYKTLICIHFSRAIPPADKYGRQRRRHEGEGAGERGLQKQKFP